MLTIAVWHFWAIWCLKFCCWSAHTPRYLMHVLLAIWPPLMFILFTLLFINCLDDPKVMYSVFLLFIHNLFVSIHSLISSAHILSCLIVLPPHVEWVYITSEGHGHQHTHVSRSVLVPPQTLWMSMLCRALVQYMILVEH